MHLSDIQMCITENKINNKIQITEGKGKTVIAPYIMEYILQYEYEYYTFIINI